MNSIQNKQYLFRYVAAALILLTLALAGCSDDPLSEFELQEISSLLVINEGNFADGNGSISSYNPENGQVDLEKFEQVNGRPMAGIIQAAVRSGDRLFIVVNNIDKIEVTDAETLESIATVTLDEENGLTPAGFATAGMQKGYVSDLFGNSVAVIDLESYEVTDTRIETGSNPRGLAVAGNRLFVADSGFGDGRTVTVIDTQTDQVTATLDVGAGPYRLVPDSAGRLWVVCNGKKAYDEDFNRDQENDEPGQIDVIDASAAQHLATVRTQGFPTSLAISEVLGLAWVVNEQAVQQIDADSYELLNEAFVERSFSGVSFSAAEGRIYLADNKGFDQSGQALAYDLQGAAVDSFQTGVAPKDFLFQVGQN